MKISKSIQSIITPIVKNLYKQGIIDKKDANRILQNSQASAVTSVHPYVNLSDYQLTNLKTGKPISVEFIVKFVAEMHELDYLKVDPTKVNVNSVTSAVSQAYATKHKILPVAVNTKTVTFAVANPADTSWVEELQRILRLKVIRVHSNPIDIQRLLYEFYGS